MANFRASEQGTAARLLDALAFASTSEVTGSLLRLLDDYQDGAPAALFPIRKLGDLGLAEAPERAVAFRDFDPTKNMSVAPGSEAIIANTLRNHVRGRKNSLGPSADLARLRVTRVRRIAFVDDFGGTGDQAAEYICSWLRNSTIRSWRSYGYVTLGYIASAATPRAMKRLASLLGQDNIHVAEQAPDIYTAGWTESEKTEVIQLCRRYAADRSDSLGYGHSGGLLLLQHTIPDNLPAILRQSRGRTASGARWAALFDGVSTLGAEYGFPLKPNRLNVDGELFRLADARLRTLLRNSTHSQLRPFIGVLACAANGIRSPERTVEATGYGRQLVISVAQSLREWELLDSQGRLTDDGRAAYIRMQRLPRSTNFGLSGSDEPYYPVSLRGARST